MAEGLVLDVVGLRKEFDGFVAVDDVTFELEAGLRWPSSASRDRARPRSPR